MSASARKSTEAAIRARSTQPAIQALLDERIVGQVRIPRQHAIDLGGLSRAQLLVRVQAPAAGEEPLTPQDLVDARNAAGKLMGGVEQRGVGVGQLGAEGEQAREVVAARIPR